MGDTKRLAAASALAFATFWTCVEGVQAYADTTSEPGAMQTFSMADFAGVMSAAKQCSSPPAPTTAAAAATSIPAGMLISHDDVSPAFTEEIRRAASGLPPGAVKALARAGYKIELSPTVTQAVPSARNEQVRGYEPHSTWDSVYGMFNRTTRKVVMAEFAQVSNNEGHTRLAPLTNQQRRQGIMRHEFGHALDNYLGNFSHSDEFRTAYNAGKATVSKPEQSTLSYYLQQGDAGAEETFAEIFASLDTTGCDRNSDVLLQEHFPELVRLVRSKIAAL